MNRTAAISGLDSLYLVHDTSTQAAAAALINSERKTRLSVLLYDRAKMDSKGKGKITKNIKCVLVDAVVYSVLW